MPSARFQIASLFLAYGAAGVFWGTLAASLPALQVRADLSDSALGLALGVMALAALPVMRVFGRMLSRIERFAIPFAMGVFAFGAALLPFLNGLGGLLIAFAITGGASGALDIALNARTARIERKTGARLFNRTHALFPAASLAAAALSGWARGEGVSLHLLFGIVVAALIISALIEYRAAEGVQPIATGTQADRAPLRGTLLLLAVLAAAAAFNEAASQSWAAVFVENVRGGLPVIAGLAPAAYTLGLSAGRLLAHTVEQRITAMQTVRAAALSALIGFALIASGLPDPLMLAAFFLAGAGIGPVEPAVFRAVATRSEQSGPALASVTAVAYLGYLFSPPILGIIGDTVGFAALWLTCAAVAVLIFATATRLAR